MLGALLLAAAACGAPEGAPTPGLTTVTGLALPFDAYKPTAAQRTLLGNAHDLLVVRCLRRHGVTGRSPGPDPVALAAADLGNTRRYGVVDPGLAARFGYHLARPVAARTPARTAAPARRHLYGHPGRPGCLDRATARMNRGVPEADWRWLTAQDARSLERAAARPAVRQAAERWKTCMASTGHPYASPTAAIADQRWDLAKAMITGDERRTALADTSCKWSSGLVAAWFATDAEVQRRVVLRQADRFAALRANLSERLARAIALLRRR